MTADIYINIINENLEESDSDWKINLSSNKTTIQNIRFGNHRPFFRSSKIKLLDRLAQSLNLNSIENLWLILDQNVNKSDMTDIEKLFEALSEAWKNRSRTYNQSC